MSGLGGVSRSCHVSSIVAQTASRPPAIPLGELLMRTRLTFAGLPPLVLVTLCLAFGTIRAEEEGKKDKTRKG